MKMTGAYYKMVVLTDEVRNINKIRSKARLDCVSYADNVSTGYKGLTKFVNSKGQLFFYKTAARDFVSSDSKRLAEWSLTNGSINFSSVYIEDMDYPELGYGYPNGKRLLSNGNPNPLFQFRNDAYLFVMNTDYTEIEIFVIIDGRNLISSYYQVMIDGGFEDEITHLRKQAKPFYNYFGLFL